jgi:hypothetical protein
MLESLGKDQANRVSEHRNHLANIAYQRFNAFLVYESVLLLVVGLLYSNKSAVLLVLLLISCLGCIVTIIWWYTLARLENGLRAITLWLKGVDPVYKAIYEESSKGISLFFSWWLLAHFLPLLILLIWVILLCSIIILP